MQEHKQTSSDEQSSKKTPSRPQGEISVFHNALELEAEARRKAELAERERQKQENEAAYQAREEYAKELAEEKVDLIRLKQGVISEEELNLPQELEKHYTIWQKIGNWFYHSKWWLWGAIFCALVGGFLIYDLVTRKNPDIRVLLLSENPYFDQQSVSLEEWIKPVCEDFNGDGEILVGTVYIPVTKENMESTSNISAAYNSQLLVQFQSDTCMLVILDERAEAYLNPDEMFVNLEELYPDCEFADGIRLHLNETDFAKQIGMTEPLHEGCYLALRRPLENMTSLKKMQKAYDKAKVVLDGIIPMLHRTQEAQSNG